MKYIYPGALLAAFLIVGAAALFLTPYASFFRSLTPVHVLFVIATAGVVLYADEQGLMWVRGKSALLSQRRLAWLHLLTGLGLAGLIATGGVLFLGHSSPFLQNPFFYTKLVFVVALIVNGFLIERLARVATLRTWASLSSRERLPLIISGGISLVSWIGAGVCGLLL